MSHTVEGVSWQLSGRLYQTVYPIGLVAHAYYALAKAAFSGFETPPELLPHRIIHTGIIVHGHVYEYCDEGIKKTKATSTGDPGSVCKVDGLLERISLGKCRKSIGDFDRWVAKQKEGKFSKEKYCVAENQCVHFAIAAANFLGVSHPEEWDKMCKFTETYPDLTKLADRSTGSSTLLGEQNNT